MSDQKDAKPADANRSVDAPAPDVNRSVDKAKKPNGAPPKYKKEFDAQALTLCEAGATDDELADFFGVKVRTIFRWKNQHKGFCQGVILGKDPADIRVERSFYNRCVGYDYDSEKIFCHQGKVTRVKIREHVPPDPAAAMNWLKARKPDQWMPPEDHSLKIDSDVTIIRFTAPPVGYVEPKTIEHQAEVRSAAVKIQDPNRGHVYPPKNHGVITVEPDGSS